jgi:hypothetical protein
MAAETGLDLAAATRAGRSKPVPAAARGWAREQRRALRWGLAPALLALSFGFLGFWGPSTTLTAEVFPTRIRGVANGVVWFMGYFVGCVLWSFATVAL